MLVFFPDVRVSLLRHAGAMTLWFGLPRLHAAPFRAGFRSLFLGLGLAAVCLAAAAPAKATVTLPALISDHMILQKSDKAALWGAASPGEQVTATLGEIKGEATADAEGHWSITLDLSQSKEGPFDLVIAGENRMVISDVLVGEVWLASGQSNMAFPLSEDSGAGQEIAGPANPRLRQFLVGAAPSPQPMQTCTGKWVVADPTSIGNFSAVGYYFGKDLQQALHTPVGLINSSVGGTVIEAWMSREALDKDPDLRSGADRHLKKAAQYEADLKAYVDGIGPWLQKFNRVDRPPADPAAFPPDSFPEGCKPVMLPGKFSAAGLPDAGATWIWKKVTLDPSALNRGTAIVLATPGGFETVYWNGVKLGETSPLVTTNAGAHVYYTMVQALQNILAIRLYTPGGNAGIGGDVNQFKVGSQLLQGEWMGKAEYPLPALSADDLQSYPKMSDADEVRNRPAYLFNGMINPLVPYAIRGTVWYQGENNTGQASQYVTALPLMIEDWRDRWKDPFPFYICQLPNYGAKNRTPSESAWAELREAQTRAQSLPNTGEAVLIDLGEEGSIHPRDKHEVGKRLSLVALAKTYGKEVPFSGPVYQSFQIEGNKIRITFKEGDGGLVTKPLPATYQPTSSIPQTVPLVRNSPNSELEGFAICGADRHWVWAEARIVGDSVLVESPDVPNPVAVRYAWADNPTCNLYNQAGLPAGPFRTDTFPLTTEGAKF